MAQKLYVGNLPYRTTEDDLRKLFEKYEPIHSLIIISDKETEQPRGYSFVELDEPKAGYALSELSDTEFNGRSLKISVAKGRDHKKRAGRKAPINTPEKLVENDYTTAAYTVLPRRNRRTTKTEYVVSDVNNYG